MKRRSNEDEEYTTSQQTPKRIRFQLSKQQESSTSPPRSFQAAQQQLPDLLSGLDQKSLIVLLLELVGSDQSLEDRIVKLLPRPTLSSTISILLNLEAKLLSSIPYSKHGPDRSDYAFNRVRPQWEELYGSLLQYLDFFTLSTSYPTTLDHEYPSESFEYLEFTTNLVHRLPNWSEEKMIQLRNPLYEKLGQHWRIVVQEVGRRAGEGKVFGDIVAEWSKKLDYHCKFLEGKFGFSEAKDDFERGLGWIIAPSGNRFTGLVVC